jgi:flagella basal body P-ring formation protein FlgA
MQATWSRHIGLTLTLIVVATTAVQADSVRLGSHVRITTASILLRDVATLEGKVAEQLGDLVVANFAAGATHQTITLTALRAMLSQQEVNWARLTLGGHSRCKVQLTAPPRSTLIEALDSNDANAEPVAANPVTSLAVDTGVSLQQRVERVIEDYLGQEPGETLGKTPGAHSGELVIQFSKSDRRKLAASVLSDRITIEPIGSATLGRIPIQIRRWHAEELLATLHVRADVALRCPAVVTTRSLRRGQIISRNDVQVTETLVSDARGTPIVKLADVLGKVLAGNLRKDSSIYPDQLAKPILVKKRALLWVFSHRSGIEIKVEARAQEDGQAGQLIRVRRLGQRQDMTVRVTARQRAETVFVAPANALAGGKTEPIAKGISFR